MAAFPCPYCDRPVIAEAQDAQLERCPSCDSSLQMAFRYRLVAHRGEIPGGVLYEAVDDIFGDTVAVLFVADPDDRAAIERFIDGNRLFGELGGRGLVKIREVSNRSERRPYVVMDWIAAGTLEAVVRKRGPIDQVTLLEIMGDLLTGLSKAHRSMPALIHGHIHPGKIGFLDQDDVALFGFEWAAQVFEQDSHLADALIESTKQDAKVTRASDMRQLGDSLYYAATGEWLGDRTQAQKRTRVRERLPGPVGLAIDRMVAAGAGGYTSAVDATLDLDELLRGTSNFIARARHVQDRSGDLRGSEWSRSDEFDDDEIEVIEPESFDTVPPPPPLRTSNEAFDDAIARAARAHEQVATNSPAQANPGKLVSIVVGAMVVFGMCVAMIIADEVDSGPDVVTTPPIERPATSIPPPSYEPRPILEELPAAVPWAELSGLHRYTGRITGPDSLVGGRLGETCEVWVEPNMGSLNCRWYIDCGTPRRRIYGGGDAGFSTCDVEDGHPTSATDEDDDAPDGAFMALLTERDPMVVVHDRWLLPPTRVVIGLDEGGGLHPGPVPAVPQAARMSREAIEAAIEAGVLPDYGDSEDEDDLPDQLSRREIMDVLEAQNGAIEGCYSGSASSLTIETTILPNGRTTDVGISPEPEVLVETRCIEAVLRAAEFPRFAGEEMTIAWKVGL